MPTRKLVAIEQLVPSAANVRLFVDPRTLDELAAVYRDDGAV